MTNVKQFKRENLRPDLCTQQWTKSKYDKLQQTTTTELHAPNLGQTHKEFGVVKQVVDATVWNKNKLIKNQLKRD